MGMQMMQPQGSLFQLLYALKGMLLGAGNVGGGFIMVQGCGNGQQMLQQQFMQQMSGVGAPFVRRALDLRCSGRARKLAAAGHAVAAAAAASGWLRCYVKGDVKGSLIYGARRQQVGCPQNMMGGQFVALLGGLAALAAPAAVACWTFRGDWHSLYNVVDWETEAGRYGSECGHGPGPRSKLLMSCAETGMGVPKFGAQVVPMMVRTPLKRLAKCIFRGASRGVSTRLHTAGA